MYGYPHCQIELPLSALGGMWNVFDPSSSLTNLSIHPTPTPLGQVPLRAGVQLSAQPKADSAV